ncbi:TPA: 6-carboxytetrahydropterin synthase QueD [bacterium]|nr:6-carboxytetrahydropterin synthase QueD [bacterium]
MYKLIFEDNFSAAHLILGYKGNCSRLHGHNYKVRVYIKKEKLDSLGMVMDFSKIKEALSSIILSLDHKNLGDIPPFDKIQQTSENIAFYIFNELSKKIDGLYEVRISEKEGRWAGYSKESNE